MSYPTIAKHKTVADFRAHLRSLDDAFDCDEELLGAASSLAQPLSVGERTIGNRFVTHPMEGWDGTTDGRPTDDTLRRWRRFGSGGAKLIWGGEAFAVTAEGRANPHQLFMNPAGDTAADLAQLIGNLREGHAEIGESTDDLYAGLQLTHSGRFCRPVGPPEPRIAYHYPALDAKYGLAPDHPVLTDAELEEIGERYVDLARHAWQAGFDFVDVKCCHGYLLHELLGARPREGVYGGSFEGRTRLFRRIVEGIRAECPGLEIGVRASIVDTFPFAADPETGRGTPRGWDDELPARCGFGLDPDDPRRFDFEEPVRFLELLREMDIRLVNLTLGSPYYNPHLQRPARFPPSDGYQPPEDPLHGVLAHLRVVRRCKQAFPDLILVGSGYSYLQDYLPHVAQAEVAAGHVDAVGLGRMLLIYPDLPRDVLAGRPLERKKICRTFSDCTTAPRKGLKSGCYPLDPYYKAMPEAEQLKAIKKGEESR